MIKLINYYIIEIKGKNPKRLLKEIFKQKVNIINIKYFKDSIRLKVSYDDYKKIKSIKTSYDIKIIKTSGKNKLYDDIKRNQVSIIFFIISIFFIMFLSKWTFFIEIDTNNKEMRNLIKEELESNNITIFSFKKNFNDLNKITNEIKNNNLDKIEWIEIENRGVITKVKVIERVSGEDDHSAGFKDIVAEKNGYIRKIYSSKGQVLKNIDDYVKKGEIIISGTIFRNDKPISKVRANGKVYAEVWYIVKVNKDINHISLIDTNKSYKKLVLKIGDNKFNIFKLKTNDNKNKKKNIFSNNLFSLYFEKEKIYKNETIKYTDRELVNLLETKAKKGIEETLEKDEYIIKQKTLKKVKENGKIYLDVFFKVYEDIAKEENLKIIKEETKEKEE